jgi:hypothetical protein
LASRLPGRIRVRHRSLRGQAACAALRETVSAWDGMLSVEANAAIGSLLLRYDPAQVAPAAMEARVAALFPATPAPPPRMAMRRLDRYAQAGMMGGLAVALAALAGAKRLHAAAGALHVAAVLVHMAVHRRKILR